MIKTTVSIGQMNKIEAALTPSCRRRLGRADRRKADPESVRVIDDGGLDPIIQRGFNDQRVFV
jgi:hypothetical protein